MTQDYANHLTGKLDEEFPELAKKAVKESLSEDSIKRAVKSWRADTYRV